MNRREAIKSTAVIGAAATLPRFAWAEGNRAQLRVGLIGCSGRGMGAVKNMMDAAKGSVKLVAIADLFPDRLKLAMDKFAMYQAKFDSCKGNFDIPESRQYAGWDAYKQLIDQADVDVVINATPPVFRPSQIEKCIKANKHVFAEKPVCIDATGYHKIIDELIPEADKRGLKVLCGTQMRYHSAIQEAVNRVRDGQIGDIIAADFLRYESSYLHGWYDVPKNLKPDDVEYQIREWLAFRWTSGDQIVEQYVHNLDMALWAIGKLPVEVVGSGGRQIDIPYPERGDRFSNCHAQYEFEDGASLTAACRQEDNTSPYAPFKVFGTKGTLLMSFGKQRILGEKPWESDYQKKPELICEHEAFFGAIRNGTPFNTLKTCADSCFVAIAGRESCYAGKRLKLAWVLEKSQQNMVPDNLKLTDKKPVEEVPVCGKYKLV